MYGIVAESADRLQWQEVPDVTADRDEVLVKVTAAGVNRADLLQAAGLYPPPPGASELLGMEVSGVIETVGDDVADWAPGDEVCALLAGGGYAEQVAVPAGQLLPIPAGVGLRDAAALPEVACTVYANIVMYGRIAPGDTLLVHGGASGIGTMAIQVGRALGATVACTAGSASKLARCRELGAELTVNYREQDFAQAVLDFTGGRGADIILDIVGAAYLEPNVTALATGGRLVVIGMQGGGLKGELDLGQLTRKRATVHGSTLRSRPLADKAAVVSAVRDGLWPLIGSGHVRPVIETILPLEEAPAAHRLMDGDAHVGKILLATATAAAAQ